MYPPIIPTAQYIVDLLKSGRDVFLTGSGGVGKSFNVNDIRKHFINALILAPTHQAAGIIGGMTFQKAFKLGIQENWEALKNYDKYNIKQIMKSKGVDSSQARMIYFRRMKEAVLESDLIILDEVSMVSVTKYEMMIRRLKSWIGDRHIPILLVGDFYQLPPVIPNSYEVKEQLKKLQRTDKKKWFKELAKIRLKHNEELLFQSKLWNFHTVELAKIMRATDRDYIKVQQLIRVGKYNDFVEEFVQSRRVRSYKEAPYNAIKLYATKREVEISTNRYLQEINEKTIHLPAYAENLKGRDFQDEVDNWVDNELQAQKDLKIKIGARAMFIATVEDQFANGDRCTILDYKNGFIKVKMDKPDSDGKDVIRIVSKYTFTKSDYLSKRHRKNVHIAEMKQYPLVIADSMTIHKVQGMTIKDPIVIDCSRMWDENGLLYVALSRAVSPDLIYLINFSKHLIKPRRNIEHFYKMQKKLGRYTLFDDY